MFQKTLACISPLQGGLSVLESMGYGVPYITDANAITGGEAFNIVDGKTGLRVNNMSIDKLKDIILDISSNKQKYIEMGNNAYKHYWSCRKPEDMAQGVIDAIEYAISKK
jgi:glycosyltransferase involved in cell wall biosynthesis